MENNFPETAFYDKWFLDIKKIEKNDEKKKSFDSLM